MKAAELYARLQADFIKEGIRDVDWAARMPGLAPYLYPAFRQNGGMGLMCDFAQEIEKVYTTVFLSEKILTQLLDGGASNAMLFSHHPTNWDLKDHNGNYAVEEKYIAALRERNIAVYILHHPLDHFGKYSTCGTLAEALGIQIGKPGFLYCGALCGVIGTTDCETAQELRERYARAVGHETSLYLYGKEDIRGERVAVCPGGGNAMFVVEEMLKNGIRTLITGVTIINDHARAVHELEKEKHINVLGGTHYSSEKFAPMRMCEYFRELGLASEFVEDTSNLFDL